MEENSIINCSEFQSSVSDWKLRHNLYQVNRNYRQLQNRLSILELEKKKKLKDIENKLNTHKKFVQGKIYKHQLKSTIENWNNSELQRSSSNSRIFNGLRESRKMNIRSKQDEMRSTNHKMFEEIKSMRKQNQNKIQLQKLQSLEVNAGKRNRVRLIQIGCKENIEGFWNTKLDNFQQGRKLDMSRKLKQHQQTIKRLQKLERNEKDLLKQIERAENVQGELTGLISNERSMDGGKLNNLYLSNVNSLE